MPHESKSIQPVPSSPSMRIMVSGANFGGAPQRERKEGEAPSLEDHLNHCGVGWFQFKIFVMAAAIVAADGMEMTVISLLRKPLSKEWELDDDTFSMLGSTVFLGLLIGNLIGGYLADIFGRKKCIIAITVVFCVFGVLSAIAPDVYIFAVSRFFTGVGVGSMVPVSDSHLLEWSPSAWRAKMAMTLTGVAFGLGAAFACVVGIVLQMTASLHHRQTAALLLMPFIYLLCYRYCRCCLDPYCIPSGHSNSGPKKGECSWRRDARSALGRARDRQTEERQRERRASGISLK